MVKLIDMALPMRGTGLLTGRARTERGYGWPLTEAERYERHYGITGGNPSLPARGTGLVSGRARTSRGLGTPLTEAERFGRHYAADSNLTGILFFVGAVAATGLIIWLASRKP